MNFSADVVGDPDLPFESDECDQNFTAEFGLMTAILGGSGRISLLSREGSAPAGKPDVRYGVRDVSSEHDRDTISCRGGTPHSASRVSRRVNWQAGNREIENFEGGTSRPSLFFISLSSAFY